MKFENSFVVQAPLPVVWETLMDVERVAPCMPGAEVLGSADGNAYKVGVRVKVGPMSMSYRGQVEISERDDAAHTATMRARAREARGQGTANALVQMTLAEQPDGTQATIDTELQLSGKAASMGRGVLADVSEQLIGEFSNNLAAMLASGEPAPGRPAAGEPAAGEAPAEAAGTAVGAAETAPTGSAPAGEARSAPPGPARTGEAPSARLGPVPTAAAPDAAAPPSASALPAGKIAARVIANRLGEPRTLVLATAAVAAVFGTIGYAIGRAR